MRGGECFELADEFARGSEIHTSAELLLDELGSHRIEACTVRHEPFGVARVEQTLTPENGRVPVRTP